MTRMKADVDSCVRLYNGVFVMHNQLDIGPTYGDSLSALGRESCNVERRAVKHDARTHVLDISLQ